MVTSRWLWKAGPERAGSTERIGRLWYRSTGFFSTTYTMFGLLIKEGYDFVWLAISMVSMEFMVIHIDMVEEKNPRFRESGDSDDEDEDDRKRRR
ncbi:hypothetical protein GW17_00013603 [Ensete ventricosum]|nr:hypothetical protein GW17_00013603 [Ensete ventricosum]RZR96103.1 hypothetical protein BHM03_00025067 [Ensete ventricosum]